MGVVIDTSSLSTKEIADVIRSAAVKVRSHKIIACDENGNRYEVIDAKQDGEVILLEIKLK